MKKPLRVLLVLLCAVMILIMPFVISSPNMLYGIKMELMNEEEDDGDEIDFGRLFFSSAKAEDDLEVEDLTDGEFASHPEWSISMDDFTVPPAPNAELYTEDSYEDESIRVRLETSRYDEGTNIYAAYIQISDPCQIRTAVANPEKPGSNAVKTVPTLAKKNNAVIAINGDNYVDKPEKTTFEYRMTYKIRSKTNRTKDILLIDDQGDFHLFIKSQGIKEFPEKLKAESKKLVNAFTFGPALVKDGELLELDDNYGYNPGGREPRAAIGQTGPLSYVLVIVQAQDRSGKSGMSQTKLAELMYELGCVQAFNLDGGNSAELVFGDREIKGMPNGDDRTLSDIIYFATIQP